MYCFCNIIVRANQEALVASVHATFAFQPHCKSAAPATRCTSLKHTTLLVKDALKGLFSIAKNDSAASGPAILRWRAVVDSTKGANQMVLIRKASACCDHTLFYVRLNE